MRRIIALLIPLVIGLFIAAYWWLPLVFNRNLFSSETFTLASSVPYTHSFFQLITFRINGDSSSATFAIENSPSIGILLIRLFVPIFALAALLFYRKNKYVLFFLGTSIVAIILAMGVYSPIPLFSFAFQHFPFFNGIQTPSRFMIFAAFGFSVLAGFTTAGIMRVKKPKKNLLNLILVGIILVAIIGPVYSETLYAFQTFELTPSQTAGMSWLSGQEPGRVVSLPWITWVNIPGTRSIVYPWNYVQMYGQESVMGGVPSRELQNSADLLNVLRSDLYNGNITNIKLLNILGVRYIVLDKNYPTLFNSTQYDAAYAALKSSSGFRLAWSGDNVTIFENLNVFPRVFVMTETCTKIDTFDTNTMWKWAQGTQYPAELSWNNNIVQNGNVSLQSNYRFTNSGRDWLNIGTNVTNINFTDYDAISFSYYLPKPQSDIRLGIALFEQDGGEYTAPIQIDTTPGWHAATIPFAAMQMATNDTNKQLDLNQIKSLWIGVTETSNYATNKIFTIYFDNMQLVKYNYIFNQSTFQEIQPGKYQVNLNLKQDSYVVLAESYDPQWVATDQQTGKTINSEPLFIALNGFQIQKGEHQITLEYKQSTPDIIGEATSVGTALACLVCLIIFPLRKRFRFKERKPLEGSITHQFTDRQNTDKIQQPKH